MGFHRENYVSRLVKQLTFVAPQENHSKDYVIGYTSKK